MIISFIKYLMVLTAGLVMGYLIFTEQVVTEQVVTEPITNKKVAEQSNSTQNADITTEIITDEPISSLKENTLEQLTVKNIQEQRLVQILTAQIAEQDIKIAELEELLIRQKNAINGLETADNSQKDKPQTLETLSMQDFESKMKDQFLDRFKGYAIELDGERLDSIKKEFNKDATKAEWNVDYENNIHAFIQDNDPERLHYVDELTCNGNMCRLKINSNQPNNWQQLFLKMTQQAWYNSITLSENSGDPSIFIYFITKPQNNKQTH